MITSTRVCRLGLVLLTASAALVAKPAGPSRSIVESLSNENTALIVGVSHGLSGIDIDVKNLEQVASFPKNKFNVTKLEEEQGTISNILAELEKASRAAGKAGTLLFYFSGHGGVGTLYAEDGLMKVEDMRASIEAGRVGLGPLKRMVLIYDSCHAGSMMEPMNSGSARTEMMVDYVVQVFSANKGRENYWDKLLVLASSEADENSLASPTGSIFTNAMMKAYKEGIAEDYTIGQFIEKAQLYTEGHHPVSRVVPESLKEEKLQ